MHRLDPEQPIATDHRTWGYPEDDDINRRSRQALKGRADPSRELLLAFARQPSGEMLRALPTRAPLP
ncbi:MAG: hypothetical protein QF382_10020 [Acidimicrobiales bacterium]|nr:hypothetical protein [Acidimicrobiales bacterium]